jgi:hypothetical protein
MELREEIKVSKNECDEGEFTMQNQIRSVWLEYLFEK